MKNPLRNDDAGKLILRLTLGVLILLHGIAKILHPGAVGAIGTQLAAAGAPAAFAYAVYIGEVVAPLMIIVGVWTRIGGLLIAINMVVALTLVHAGQLFLLTKNGGWQLELQGFYLLCGVALVFFGSGRYAAKPD
ncbi:MAG: DoxX family protein [Burkholderiales bacterium]